MHATVHGGRGCGRLDVPAQHFFACQQNYGADTLNSPVSMFSCAYRFILYHYSCRLFVSVNLQISEDKCGIVSTFGSAYNYYHDVASKSSEAEEAREGWETDQPTSREDFCSHVLVPGTS